MITQHDSDTFADFARKAIASGYDAKIIFRKDELWVRVQKGDGKEFGLGCKLEDPQAWWGALVVLADAGYKSLKRAEEYEIAD